MSDSSYVAFTQHRRPFSTTGRPPVLELVDDAWAADSLSDDEIETGRQELSLAPLLEEDEMDADTVVVTTGNLASAANSAAERRRREEGWTDLALDQFLEPNPVATVSVSAQAPSSSGGGNAQ